MRLRMKNFDILGIIQLLGGGGGEGFIKNWYKAGDCLKKGAWQFADLRGGACQEREGAVFERMGGGWYPKAHYVIC